MLRTTKGEEKIQLTQMYGDLHEYAGMTIYLSKKNKAIISMFDYVENTIHDFPEFLQSPQKVSTPAANHFFYQ